MTYINNKDPHFAILSLRAFLAWRQTHGLQVLGTVEGDSGGREYHVISRKKLGRCAGKKLASNHARYARFVQHVLGFDLEDYRVVKF